MWQLAFSAATGRTKACLWVVCGLRSTSAIYTKPPPFSFVRLPFFPFPLPDDDDLTNLHSNCFLLTVLGSVHWEDYPLGKGSSDRDCDFTMLSRQLLGSVARSRAAVAGLRRTMATVSDYNLDQKVSYSIARCSAYEMRCLFAPDEPLLTFPARIIGQAKQLGRGQLHQLQEDV